MGTGYLSWEAQELEGQRGENESIKNAKARIVKSKEKEAGNTEVESGRQMDGVAVLTDSPRRID